MTKQGRLPAIISKKYCKKPACSLKTERKIFSLLLRAAEIEGGISVEHPEKK